MQNSSKRIMVLFALIAVITILVVGVSTYNQQIQMEATAEAKRIAEKQRQEVEKIRIQEEELAELNRKKLLENLSVASEARVRQIFRSCKGEIREHMNRVNKGPFQPFLVDEYSADRYQATAYFSDISVESEDARVSNFLEVRGGADEVALDHYVNLSYAVIFTEDTFSGPTQEVRSYRCAMAKDMAIDRVF